MLCRFWIGNNRHWTVRMVKQSRDDWTKHPPAECTPPAAHHDHLGIVRCMDKRRHYAVVHALGANVRPLLTGQFLDDLSCLLQDLTRLEFLALCNGVVRAIAELTSVGATTFMSLIGSTRIMASRAAQRTAASDAGDPSTPTTTLDRMARLDMVSSLRTTSDASSRPHPVAVIVAENSVTMPTV